MIMPREQPRKSVQQIANDAHAIVMRHYAHPGTRLIYMYIEPYSDGELLFPTKAQVAQCIPNSNGFSTPLENCCLTTSQCLDTMVSRYNVTRRRKHAEEARSMYLGLHNLWNSSRYVGFVPRGVLPDGKTHYQDVSIDQLSFWVMGMWRYYRSDIATADEKNEIRRVLSGFFMATEKAGWKCLREDGLVSFWCDLMGQSKVSRAPLILLLFCKVAFDVTEDPHWAEAYHAFVRRFIRLEDTGRSLLGPSWVSSQSSWIVDVLHRLEGHKHLSEYYRRLSLMITRGGVKQMSSYAQYDACKAYSDYTLLSKTYRNVFYGLILLATCVDASCISRQVGLCERVIRHYNFRRDGKIVDLIDPIVRYYWRLAERGILPYDPKQDVEGDGSIVPIPRQYAYRRNPHAEWQGYDPKKKIYYANRRNENRYYYRPANPSQPN